MEQRLTPPPCASAPHRIPFGPASGGARSVATETSSAKRGFMLITVLVITAVGILFGAGALLLFRYQCQLRIDRQHELEKVYAVRSTLNYINNNANNITEAGMSFDYHTGSERDLNLLAKPVKRVFPDPDNPAHLDISNIGGNGRVFKSVENGEQYNKFPDYEYGRSGTRKSAFGIENYFQESDSGRYGLLFPLHNALRGAKWWVNIGMTGTGGWLHEKYGRRYFFETRTYVQGNTQRDVMRLCIVRSVTNASNNVGERLGWPLSREGERAIVFEFHPLGQDDGENAEIKVFELLYSGGIVQPVARLIEWGNLLMVPTYVGLQLAGGNVSVFQSENANSGDKFTSGWKFSPDDAKLTSETYSYFEEGCTFDADGEIVASPDIRAVFEIEANSDLRPTDSDAENPNEENDGGANKNNNDFLADFRVTPAYQFDVFLEHPASVTNLATVAQRILVEKKRVGGRTRNIFSVRTYDTHGTEHKGFRKDEKDFEEAKRTKGH